MGNEYSRGEPKFVNTEPKTTPEEGDEHQSVTHQSNSSEEPQPETDAVPEFNTPTQLKFEHEASLAELGLGTGMDITSNNMWGDRNIRMQVREVADDQSNIKVSESSNEMDERAEIVEKLRSHQLQMKSGLNHHIRIEVHAEKSRQESTEAIVFYKKIHTRSVSFKDTDPANTNYFEKVISSWVVSKCGLDLDDPSAVLEKYMNDSSAKQKVAEACELFVKTKYITHYVSSIDLGALRHGAYTVNEYKETYGGGIDVTAKIAKAKLSGQVSEVLRHSQSRIKTVGNVDNLTRGTTRCEGVIAFGIKSIDTLVGGELQGVLQDAVKKYIQERIPDDDRPSHYIACRMGADKVYWKVNEKLEIGGTTDIKKASCFVVTSTLSAVHKREFYIHYYDKHGCLFYFLCGGNLIGYNEGPLMVQRDVNYKDAHFVLHGQERRMVIAFRTLQFPFTNLPCTYEPKPLEDWFGGDDFYISCSRRRFKVDGYVAMSKTAESEYNLVCVGVPGVEFKEKKTVSLFHLVNPAKP